MASALFFLDLKGKVGSAWLAVSTVLMIVADAVGKKL
jgi:hypothetical protein